MVPSTSQSQLVSKLLSLQREMVECGLTVTLSQDTFPNGLKQLSLKVTVETEKKQIPRRKKKKSANQKKKEIARLLAWREKRQVERELSAASRSTPMSKSLVYNPKKRKVSSAELSPPPRQDIPQYDGGGDCSFDSTTMFLDITPEEEWFSDQDPSLGTREETQDPATCIAEEGVESLGERVPAPDAGRTAAGEPAAGEPAAGVPPCLPELKCFLPHSENEFNCRYCLTLNDITRNKENLSHNRFICWQTNIDCCDSRFCNSYCHKRWKKFYAVDYDGSFMSYREIIQYNKLLCKM